MSNEQSFGQLVKARRRELGLTQDELARRVGCAPVTIRKIEYDELRPSVQIAERLAMALVIPLEERAAFVRLARAEREAAPTPTPTPTPEEIGLEDLSGRAIRGYALGERIGSGGMGAVYRGVQPLVDREVAVKIILPQYANHPEFIRRFEAEAQLVARLEHPHIVPLYDYWREPSVAFLVMRLLRGGSLRGLIESGPLPIEMAVRMLEQVGSALATAHRAGVIHRDLKPANILLDEDHNAYLADFGIAKNLGNPNLEDQTQVDAIVGSPAYISPEQIRSEFVRPQTDIYALGVVLYELLTGHLPFYGPTPIEIMHQHLSAPLPPLAARRTGLPGTLDNVIERATAKDPLARYPDVDSLLADLHRAVRGELQVAVPETPAVIVEAPPLTAADNPYKGLRAFGEGDAAEFFGREALTQQLLIRLGEGGDLSRFLAVVGPSGSGKSSVVKAGLIPALRRGGLPGSDQWFIVELMPGAHPLEELEAALLRIAVNPPESLLAQLGEDKRGLLRAVRRCLPDDPNVELVLVIDQFEEVFTLAQDEATRAHLLDSLVAAVLDDRSRLRVIVTLRADFTDRPLSYVDFGELVRQRAEFVLPLTPDELEHAIVGPAERVGLTLEPGLAEIIIRDVGEQPGTLPLLQYALTELFEKREGRTLTKAAYHAIGGVTGALAKRAEEVFAGLKDAEQSAARQLFLRLVTLGEGTEDTRRRVLRSELESLDSVMLSEAKHLGPASETLRRFTAQGDIRPVKAVIESFGKHRLLSFDRDPLTRGPTVEVAHEALLREWRRLREWLSESRADVRMQRQLANAAAEWQSANRDSSFLLTGARLEQFEGWSLNTTLALTGDERGYLDASISERERTQAEEATRQRRELEAARKLAETERARAEEQTHSANRLRLRNRVITTVGAVALVLAVLAGVFGFQSESSRRLATARELAYAALANLKVDPERSILLALQAVSATRDVNGSTLPEAEEALHRSVLASHVRLTLVGHTTPLIGVVYSPDGKRLATIGKDGTVKVWIAATGQELLSLPGATPLVDAYGPQRLAFSPDGALLASSDNNLVKIWDAVSGRELRTLSGHTADVWAVAFSPDGKRLATGGVDTTVQVWEIATGELLLTLSGHTDAIELLAFSPDGTRLASSSDDGTIKVWESVTGELLFDFASPAGSVAFSPDGTRLAIGVPEGVKVLDAISGQDVLTIPAGTGGFVFSPDWTRLVTGSEGTEAKVWNARTGQELLTLSGHAQRVADAAFSPDGKHLATASFDQTARIWDITPDQEIFTLPDSDRAVAFSPDGTLLATGGTDGGVRLWSATTGQNQWALSGHSDWVWSVAFSPDGKHLATSSADTTAKVWEVATGRPLLDLLGHTILVRDIAYSPDGSRIATASFDQTAKVWDAVTGQELFSLSGHAGFVTGVAFSPDGKRLATSGSQDARVIIWDAAAGQSLLTLLGHAGTIADVAFSPDGTRLATASWDTTAKIWDAATGAELLTLSGHQASLQTIAFSPDGKLLATGSKDSTVKIWEVSTGKELQTLFGPTGEVTSVAFSLPDGARLAIASSDGSVRVYALRLEDLMALAQSRVTRTLTTDECQKYLHVGVCPGD